MNKPFLILIFGILLVSFKASSQEVIKDSAQLDIGKVIFVGMVDSTIASDPYVIQHYLLLKNNDATTDTIWKNFTGRINNQFMSLYGIYSKNNYCSFILSSFYGKSLVIAKRDQANLKWSVEGRYRIPVKYDDWKLTGIYFTDEKTIVCRYYDLPTEIFKVESGELKKYDMSDEK
jgi:hypothetical protein